MIFIIAIILLCCIPFFTVLTSVINPAIFIICYMIFLIYCIRSKNKINIQSTSVAIFLLFIITFIPLLYNPNIDIVFLNTLIISSAVLMFILTSFNKAYYKKILQGILYGASLNFIISLIRYFNYTDTRLDGIINYANSSALLFFIGICIYFFITIEYGNSIINDLCFFLLNCALIMTFSRSLYIVYFSFIIWLFLYYYKNLKQYLLRLFALFIGSCLTSYLLISRYFLPLLLLIPLIALLFFIPNKVNNKKGSFKLKPLYFIITLFILSIPLCILAKYREINLDTFKERLVIMKDSLHMILKHPWGLGFGNYPLFQQQFCSANYETKFIHNSYLQFIVDFGILNGILLLIILFLVFKNIFVNNRDNKKLLIFPLISAIVIGTIDFSLSNSTIIIIIAMLIGLLYENKITNATDSKWILNLASLPLLIAVCILLPKQIMYNCAAIEFSNNNFGKASSILTNGQALPINSSVYYEKLGASIFNSSNNSKDFKSIQSSIIYFNKAKALTPYDSKLYKDLGKCFLTIKKYEEAENNFNSALTYRKYDFEAIMLIKECYKEEYTNEIITENEFNLKINKLKEKCSKINEELKEPSKFMKNQKINP